MNRVRKGRKNESKASDMLIEQGWMVEKPTWSRFGHKDFFNMFDLIAVHPRSGRVRFIQVKTNGMPSPAYRKMLSSFIESREHSTVELWIWYDRNPVPRIIIL